MTMNMRRGIGGCAAFLLLTTMGLAAGTSEVADAVMRGDSVALDKLLTAKADVNTPQADGATALHWAVSREDLAAVDRLLKAGANAKTANQYGATPLFLAVENGNPAITGLLLDAGADANERSTANTDTVLMMAARTGNIATIKLLLDRGADVNAKEATGTTPLMWAAAQGHSAAVQLLVDRGADVSAASNPAYNDRPVGCGRCTDPRPSRGRNTDNVVSQIGGRNTELKRGGGLTPLAFAARVNDLESARTLLAAGADVNQLTNYGWSPLLIATQNRYYQLASFLLDQGADPNLNNKSGWSPLYIATDNRNLEGGDYPQRRPDMDHLDLIKKLIAKGADVNWRLQNGTWGRSVFSSTWVGEGGATAFWRASQSSDLVLMKLLLAHGADPNINNSYGVTPLAVSAGIGWVEGLTYEWSKEANVEAAKLLLSLGNDPNQQDAPGRTALHGAGHKGASGVIQVLVDAGAKVDIRDYGMSGNDAGGFLLNHTWMPVDYADGLIRIGTQSAIVQPEAGQLLRKLMTERGIPAPPFPRSLESVCMGIEHCDDVDYEALKLEAKADAKPK